MPRSWTYAQGFIKEHTGPCRPGASTYPNRTVGNAHSAVAALEDKIVQRATIGVLNAIYEEDFLGFSYAFRPKRGQHDALDALVVGITIRKVNFVLDVGHHWVRASGSRALRADTHHPAGPGLPVPCILKRERTVPIVPRLLKGGNREWALPTVRFGYVDAPGRKGPVCSFVKP